jgi:hypothetical protein
LSFILVLLASISLDWVAVPACLDAAAGGMDAA